MAIISSYSDDASTTDSDKFFTYASDGTAKLTPASNVNKYLGTGWTIATDSWSYSSYNSTTRVAVINASASANTRYSVGMWIMFTQPTLGTKYGRITAVGSSSVTAVLNSGNQLDNEAISSPYFSTGGAPFGSGGGFEKYTDSNGWTVYDNITWKVYRKRVTYSQSFTSGTSAGLALSSSTLPTGMSTLSTNFIKATLAQSSFAYTQDWNLEMSSSSSGLSVTAVTRDSGTFSGFLDIEITTP